MLGEKTFIPFRQLGQYEDEELEGLYYNRFRYYDCNIGGYISQDPIGLEGNNPNFYAYVEDSNSWIDVFGLHECYYQGDLDSMPFTAADEKGLKSLQKAKVPHDKASREWDNAVNKAKSSIEKGEKFQVKVKTKADADAFLREMRDGKGMNRYRNHMQKELKYTEGYEVHQAFDRYPELGGNHAGVKHIKYYNNGTNGHIFFESF